MKARDKRAQGLLRLVALMLVGLGLAGCGIVGSGPSIVVDEADGSGRPTAAEADAMLRDLKACYEEEGFEVEFDYSKQEGLQGVSTVGPEDGWEGDYSELADRCNLNVVAIFPTLNLSPEQIAAREKVSLERQKCMADEGFVSTVNDRGGLSVSTDDQPEGTDMAALEKAEEDCYEAFAGKDG